MSHSKILTILENYKSLSNDIKKIERKTVFLKEKKSDLEDILKKCPTQENLFFLTEVGIIER